MEHVLEDKRGLVFRAQGSGLGYGVQGSGFNL